MYSSYKSPDNNNKYENTYAAWPKEKNTWGNNDIKNKQYPPPPSSPPPPLPPPPINRTNKPMHDNAKPTHDNANNNANNNNNNLPSYANNPFFDDDIAL